MWILIVANFIVMMMMTEVLCWPSMSNIAALYTENDMFLNFEEVVKGAQSKFLLIAFKNYLYFEVVNMTFSESSSEF